MILDEIVAHKRQELESYEFYRGERKRKIYNLKESLTHHCVIAEVKKASPSLGDINITVSPSEQAMLYAKGGLKSRAGAISVLTDRHYFKGDILDLIEVANNVEIPVLRKDFIVDTRQIDEAYCAGADAILLIATSLTENELKTLSEYAFKLGLDVLFEVHHADELKKMRDCKVNVAGVNSRNLQTMKIDKETGAEHLRNAKKIYDFVVAESGIESRADVELFRKAGADAFLVGSYFMKSDKVAEAFNIFD